MYFINGVEGINRKKLQLYPYYPAFSGAAKPSQKIFITVLN